jgi:hypothetical protein
VSVGNCPAEVKTLKLKKTSVLTKNALLIKELV